MPAFKPKKQTHDPHHEDISALRTELRKAMRALRHMSSTFIPDKPTPELMLAFLKAVSPGPNGEQPTGADVTLHWSIQWDAATNEGHVHHPTVKAAVQAVLDQLRLDLDAAQDKEE